MKLAVYLCLSAICLSAMPRVASAQDTEIKFVVPVRLTNLMPEIEQVLVACVVSSAATLVNPPDPAKPSLLMTVQGTKIRVINGQVVANAEVVAMIPRLKDPAGKTATYSCRLQGGYRSPVEYTFMYFLSNHTIFALRLPVQPLQGTFDLVDQTAAAP